jgi:predicted acetyltransferase
MMDNLHLKNLRDINHSQWIEYWKELIEFYSKAGESVEGCQRVLNEDWDEKLVRLKEFEERGLPPYGLKGISTVLMNNDKIVGHGSIFLNIEVVPAEEVPNHIGATISPLYRNRGYGTHMVHLSIKELDKLGYKEIIISCADTNISSSRMIEKNYGVLKEKVIKKSPIPGVEDRLWRRYIVNVKESIKRYENDRKDGCLKQ